MQYFAESMEKVEKVSQNAPRGLMRRAEAVLSKEKNAQEKETAVIIDNDGIFTISNNIEFSAVRLDPALKNLVDSVVFRSEAQG